VATQISEDDLRKKFSALQDEVQGKVDDQKTSIAAGAAALGVVLLLVMFMLGKRSGKKKSAIVEIRRV
jgi:hypothetical protein